MILTQLDCCEMLPSEGERMDLEVDSNKVNSDHSLRDIVDGIGNAHQEGNEVYFNCAENMITDNDMQVMSDVNKLDFSFRGDDAFSSISGTTIDIQRVFVLKIPY